MLFFFIYQHYRIFPLQGWSSYLFYFLKKEVTNFFKLLCLFSMKVWDNMEPLIYFYVLCWNTEMTELCLTKGQVCQLLKELSNYLFFWCSLWQHSLQDLFHSWWRRIASFSSLLCYFIVFLHEKKVCQVIKMFQWWSLVMLYFYLISLPKKQPISSQDWLNWEFYSFISSLPWLTSLTNISMF